MGVSLSKDSSDDVLSKSQARSLLQRKICLSEDNPEPIYDISCCQLSCVPSSVYAKCKVLLKRRLLLNDNCLSSLDRDGSLAELAHVLYVLVVSRNRLVRLPDSVFQLQQLQVLDISDNRVKQLPPSVGRLVKLRVLVCAANQLVDVPAEIGDLPALRSLDLRRNRLNKKFPALNNAHTMRELRLEGNMQLVWPAQDTVSQGSDAVLSAICQEIGKQRTPVDELIDDFTPGLAAALPADGLAPQFGAGPSLVEMQRQKEQDRLLEERELARQDKQRLQLVACLSEQQCRMDGQLSNLARRKQEERERLLLQLCRLESSADQAVARISALASRLSDPETIAARLQADEQRLSELVNASLRSESLRKQEVCQSMLTLIEENFLADVRLYSDVKQRHDIVRDTMTRDREMEVQLAELFQLRDQQQQARIQALQSNEIFQRQAFHSLFLEQDANRQAIIGNILQAEQALAQLSVLETNHRNSQNVAEMERLAEKREQLAALLSQLLSQRDSRELQLRLRLQELDEQRQQHSNNFWLVQFQKLLDSKPADIRRSEAQLDPRVRCLLEDCGLGEHTVLFAAKQISYKSLLYMNDEELKKVGLERSARELLLAHLAGLSIPGGVKGEERPRKDAGGGSASIQPPSAPSDPGPSTSVAQPPNQDEESTPPSAPEEVLLRMEMECTVCMERKTDVVFLTCGHACSCHQCSGQLDKCPMCRQNISQRLLMTL